MKLLLNYLVLISNLIYIFLSKLLYKPKVQITKAFKIKSENQFLKVIESETCNNSKDDDCYQIIKTKSTNDFFEVKENGCLVWKNSKNEDIDHWYIAKDYLTLKYSNNKIEQNGNECEENGPNGFFRQVLSFDHNKYFFNLERNNPYNKKHLPTENLTPLRTNTEITLTNNSNSNDIQGPFTIGADTYTLLTTSQFVSQTITNKKVFFVFSLFEDCTINTFYSDINIGPNKELGFVSCSSGPTADNLITMSLDPYSYFGRKWIGTAGIYAINRELDSCCVSEKNWVIEQCSHSDMFKLTNHCNKDKETLYYRADSRLLERSYSTQQQEKVTCFKIFIKTP